jgi:tetratricopeptide (TPR) repeat protein
MLHIKYQLRDIGRGYTSIKGIMDRYPEISQKEQIVQIYAKAKHLMLPEKMPKNKAVAVLVREGCDIDLAGNICDEIEKHFYPRKQRPTNIFGKVWRYIRNKRLIIIYMKGRKYTNSGKYKQAVACYEKAINMAPNIPDAYHFMGNCYVLQEHYRQAIDYYEQAIENFNNHESSYLALSICYQELGDTERSVTCLVKALKNSNDGHIYGILSFVKLGMYEEAIACCKTALGLKPHDESLTSHICNVLTIADSSMRHGTDKTDEQAPE